MIGKYGATDSLPSQHTIEQQGEVKAERHDNVIILFARHCDGILGRGKNQTQSHSHSSSSISDNSQSHLRKPCILQWELQWFQLRRICPTTLILTIPLYLITCYNSKKKKRRIFDHFFGLKKKITNTLPWDICYKFFFTPYVIVLFSPCFLL